MIVSELIEELKKLPQNAVIVHYDNGDGGYGASYSVPALTKSDLANIVVIDDGIFSMHKALTEKDMKGMML